MRLIVIKKKKFPLFIHASTTIVLFAISSSLLAVKFKGNFFFLSEPNTTEK